MGEAKVMHGVVEIRPVEAVVHLTFALVAPTWTTGLLWPAAAAVPAVRLAMATKIEVEMAVEAETLKMDFIAEAIQRVMLAMVERKVRAVRVLNVVPDSRVSLV
jgi:hypothetical protein